MNIQPFIDHLKKTRNDFSSGIPSKIFYSEGKKFGLKCREIKETFLTKANEVSRGLYLVTPNKGPGPVLAKKVPKKKEKGNRDTVREWKHGDLTQPDIVMAGKTEKEFGVVEHTEDSFVWIATPAEIKSEITHETDY